MTTEKQRVRGLRAIVLGLALALAGCGERDLGPEFSRRPIALNEVPASVLAAAQKQLPGVRFTDAWKNLDHAGQLHSFEIKGRTEDRGKIREVRVSPTGAILEME